MFQKWESCVWDGELHASVYRWVPPPKGPHRIQVQGGIRAELFYFTTGKTETRVESAVCWGPWRRKSVVGHGGGCRTGEGGVHFMWSSGETMEGGGVLQTCSSVLLSAVTAPLH